MNAQSDPNADQVTKDRIAKETTSESIFRGFRKSHGASLLSNIWVMAT